MTPPIDNLLDDLESLKRLLAAERVARIDAETKAASAEAAAARAAANVSSAEALIAHLKLAIEKMRRELYGSRSERGRKLVESQVLDQMELELEDLEAAAAEDELAAEMAAAKTGGETTLVSEHARRKPVRKPFPAHLPRERVIVSAPAACTCCGSTRLSKLGEDVTETLEVIPR